MKLRCATNSIRFRLRKSDVKLLKENTKLEEYIHFSNDVKFIYGLILTDKQSAASCADNCMLVEIHKPLAEEWMNSNEVSLKIKLPIVDKESLNILIEKDFPCKHTGDDFEDTYYELQPEKDRMFGMNTVQRTKAD